MYGRSGEGLRGIVTGLRGGDGLIGSSVRKASLRNGSAREAYCPLRKGVEGWCPQNLNGVLKYWLGHVGIERASGNATCRSQRSASHSLVIVCRAAPRTQNEIDRGTLAVMQQE